MKRSHPSNADSVPPQPKKAKQDHSNGPTYASVPAYTPFTVSTRLPPLPPVTNPELTTAIFTHRSTVSYSRTTTSSTPALTYDRLEFLGDAYIELIATRLIYARFPYLPVGRQSQLRELVVKNETLAEYSRAYGFDKRVEVGALDRMVEEGKQRGNKGFNKVLGDLFEAYVAAVVLSDAEEGFAVVEKWLTGLWAGKLEEAVRGEVPGTKLRHEEGEVDMSKVYDPAAKAELQRRVMGKEVKLSYEADRPFLELKGDQLGQNRHFVALYLTGYGYERKLLGKGEGRNKVEAGSWAATEAMYGETKELVEECAEKLKVVKKAKEEDRARKAAEKEAAAAGSPPK
ncbi:hypothetical protein LTR09_005033 [Extremus antarcticus]|uniref:RNase III domain-containing protein n=1 Tax=Extremus antarcticus TaxID=702011 RepID=A0AAJ0G8V3_9PEZI|nr:hypothetical protein LTR09_005033 [Extremus antarcticus]